MLQFPRARLVLESTPQECAGLFWQRYSERGRYPQQLTLKVPTRLGMPVSELSDDELQRFKNDDPLGGVAEYDAEFVGSTSSFFSRELVESTLRLAEFFITAPADHPGEVLPDHRKQCVGAVMKAFGYSASWDSQCSSCVLCPAWLCIDVGLQRDAFAAVVSRYCRAGSVTRLQVPFVRRWVPSKGKPNNLLEIEDELVELYRLWGCKGLLADQYSFESVAAHLRARGLSCRKVVLTPQEKLRQFGRLKSLMMSNRADFIDDPVLAGELTAMEIDFSDAGLLRFAAPVGKFDDVVHALALAAGYEPRVVKMELSA